MLTTPPTSFANVLSQSLTIPTSFKSSIKEDFDPRILETDPSSLSPTSKPKFKLNISPTYPNSKRPQNPHQNHPSSDFHNILLNPKTTRDYYPETSNKKFLTNPDEISGFTHVFHTMPSFDSPGKDSLNYSSLKSNPRNPPPQSSRGIPNNDLFDILSVKAPMSARNNGAKSPVFDTTQSFYPGNCAQETSLRGTVRPAAASQAYMNAMKALQEKTKGLEEKLLELQTENLLLKGYGNGKNERNDRRGRDFDRNFGKDLRELEEENLELWKGRREVEKKYEVLEEKNKKLKKKIAGMEEKEKEGKSVLKEMENKLEEREKKKDEEILKIKKDNEELKMKNNGLIEKIAQMEKEITGNKKMYNQHIQYLKLENEALKTDVGHVKDYYGQELEEFQSEFNAIQEDNLRRLKEYEQILSETDKYTNELKELLALKNKEIEVLRTKTKERETQMDISGALELSCSVINNRRSALYDVTDPADHSISTRNGTPIVPGRKEGPPELNKNHKNVRKFFLELNKINEQDMTRKSEASNKREINEENGTPSTLKQAFVSSSKGASMIGKCESSVTGELQAKKAFDINALFPGYNAAMASCLNSSRFLRNDESEIIHEEILTNREGQILDEEVIYGKNMREENEREREEREEQRRGGTQIDSSNKKTRVHGNFSFGGTPKGTQQQQFAFESKRGVGAGTGRGVQPNQAGRRRDEYKELRLEEMSENNGEDYQVIEDEVNELI